MSTVPQKLRTIQFHVLAWLAFCVYEQSLLLFSNAPQVGWLSAGLNYLLNATLFYANAYWLMPRLLGPRRRALLYVGAASGLLLIYAVLRCELYLHLVPHIQGLAIPIHTPYTSLWVLSLYRGSFFLFISVGVWFARNAISLEKQQREQEHQMRVTERSLMDANLAFLKSQINPHFLFNSLNFLYAQVYPHSENAAKGILLLSDTMRYALQKDDNGKVMLAQEVQHLNNYIAINQLRFNNQLQVDFNIVGSVNFLMILPLILITFVENCFKHGELNDNKAPMILDLTVVQNRLTFVTHNKKRDGPKEKSTGIGLVNTRKRLELMYGNRYTLTIDDDPMYYTCSLTIEL